MTELLKKEYPRDHFEILIDTGLFNPNTILTVTCDFLDRGYFFSQLDENENFILQFTKKNDTEASLEEIIKEFSDELVSTASKDELEGNNKDIGETGNLINRSAVQINKEINRISFDKEIDNMLQEIESDPTFKIDKEEIERVFREIESGAVSETIEPTNFLIDHRKIKNAKKKFQSRI